jgi:hypothetical protein
MLADRSAPRPGRAPAYDPPVLRTLATAALVLVLAAGGAVAADAPGTVVVARPAFAGPAATVPPGGAVRFDLVSSRRVDPAAIAPRPGPPAWAPRHFRGAELVVTASQPGTTFLGYGDHAGLTRWLVAKGPAHRTKAVLDVTSLGRAGSWPLELRWAWQAGGTVYLANAHRTYAATTRNRNAYLTAVSADDGRVLWQSPALVANADRFAVVGDVIVTGYGFTAEPDWLYAIDRRSGALLGRLALPSAPEWITARGRTLTVRTYDHRLVVRLRTG